MQNNFLKNKILITLVVVFMMVFSFADSVSALFFNTSSTPPNNNISYPVNVGPDFQTKSGLMIVNGFRVLGPVIFDSTIKIPTGAGAGKVLTSDANGNATWQNLGAGSGTVWGSIGDTNGDLYTQQADLNSALSLKANLDGPTFLGSLQAPTPNSTDNSDKLATTAFVTTAVNGASSGNNGWVDAGTVVSLFNVLDNVVLGSNTNIYRGSTLFIHNTGSGNMFAGLNAGNLSLTGNNNTAVGYVSMTSLSSGSNNTALGSYSSWKTNTASNNTGVGYAALLYNSSGDNNTALGTDALRKNISGSNNTAVGNGTLLENLNSYNTAVGNFSLDANTSGSTNTAIGYAADVSTTNLENATAIGYGATVNASNKIRFGNSFITVIEGQVAWSNPSDLRLKENIQDSDLGLEFIKKLRPVSFKMKNSDGIDYGFIAQEVEEAIGKNTNIVLTDNSKEQYKSMRYTNLIAPLTKAVQEQQEEIAGYRARLETLKERARVLEQELSN